MRHKWIKVKADNYGGTLHFDYEAPANKPDDINNSMETACVQHEIDHLDGITMFDREYKATPWVRKSPKIGRNEKVIIGKGSEVKTIKYKKFEQMEKDGWALTEV